MPLIFLKYLETMKLGNLSKLCQIQRIEEEKAKCFDKIKRSYWHKGFICPVTWDGLMCWPSVMAGKLAQLPCPEYIHGFDHNAFATRKCSEDGTWFIKQSLNETWTNYSQCLLHFIEKSSGSLQDHVDNIKTISQIGYSISLLTLIFASFILSTNKRLHCPRNILHLHLFFSFIIRSMCFLLKSTFFAVDLQVDTQNTSFCKILTIIWQYSLLANYNWILMEGLYLHTLIFVNIFNDKSSIFKYTLMGWCLPILFIIPWIVIKIIYENTFCWTINQNKSYFWIIRGPITISIILNFIFFINITRVLFRKLFSKSNVVQTSRAYKYSKWLRSTLVLVPLFGIHYALLLVASSFASKSPNLEIIWLYTDILFTSFQGFFVTLFYCFLNSEIQKEFKKYWQSLFNLQSSYRLLLTQIENRWPKFENRKDSKFSVSKKTDNILITFTHDLNIDNLSYEPKNRIIDNL